MIVYYVHRRKVYKGPYRDPENTYAYEFHVNYGGFVHSSLANDFMRIPKWLQLL